MYNCRLHGRRARARMRRFVRNRLRSPFQPLEIQQQPRYHTLAQPFSSMLSSDVRFIFSSASSRLMCPATLFSRSGAVACFSLLWPAHIRCCESHRKPLCPCEIIGEASSVALGLPFIAQAIRYGPIPCRRSIPSTARRPTANGNKSKRRRKTPQTAAASGEQNYTNRTRNEPQLGHLHFAINYCHLF